jgi:pimeloyl-ACP methyl ester carboxylesterase
VTFPHLIARLRGAISAFCLLPSAFCLLLSAFCLFSPSFASAQTPGLLPMPESAATPYLVFFRSTPVGREDVLVMQTPDGWIVRGASRLGPPIDVTTRVAEVIYDSSWRPRSLLVDGVVRGQDVTLKTTFADGKASNVIAVQGAPQSKVDAVAVDTIPLPNTFLGSYAALGMRLRGKPVGAELKAYIAPQGEVPVTVTAVANERIDTPRAQILSTRYGITVANPAPVGDIPMTIWVDASGGLLRFSVPSQGLEMAREDIASAASRTAAFSAPGDEAAAIPASGFNLAATITRPPAATGPLPAVILIGGSGPTDRDETVAGIPIFGQLARDLVGAGFFIVRYDKRGVGQSGGRAESVTLSDYEDDVRSVVEWLKKRKDVDKKRIALVGHSEGALVALQVAARERDDVAALVVIAAPSANGSVVVLEQQKRALDAMKMDEAERKAKIALQERINAAVIGKGTWEEVPAGVRKQAETPWFHSFLTFEPADVLKDTSQPMLVVQGELDAQVPPYHADKLAELARARKRKADVQVLKVPGINHLLVPAKTGEVDEYASLGSDAQVSPALTSGIATWLNKTLPKSSKK